MTTKSSTKSQSPKTSARIGKFAIIGIILALFNFAIYTFLARVIMNTNELLWLDSIISYIIATILAFFLHSKITWKERHITKRGIIMFFFWNGLTAIAISPLFTWLFGFIKPLYEFAHNISSAIHLPFDYAFIESTGIFCLTTCVTMILNYIFYDRLVFGITPVHYPPIADDHSKVSIIVPIYNVKKYLPDCLKSIAAQSYQNLEVILIDDGSTDGSSQIAKKFTKSDSRFKYFHQPNAGQSAARNTGLTKTTGDYVSFVDADDTLASDFIADLLAPFAATSKSLQPSLSVCGIHYKRLSNHTAEDVYLKPLRPRGKHESLKAYILYLLAIDGRMYSSVNKLYRADIATKCCFDTSLNFAEDTKFVLDYLAKSKHDPAFILKPLYSYNFGTESSTVSQTSLIWQNWQASYANLKSWLGTHPPIKEKFWLHLVHLRWRISFIRSKRRAKP